MGLIIFQMFNWSWFYRSWESQVRSCNFKRCKTENERSLKLIITVDMHLYTLLSPNTDLILFSLPVTNERKKKIRISNQKGCKVQTYKKRKMSNDQFVIFGGCMQVRQSSLTQVLVFFLFLNFYERDYKLSTQFDLQELFWAFQLHMHSHVWDETPIVNWLVTNYEIKAIIA